MTYSDETLTLNKKSINKILTTQRVMERSMLGASFRNKISNAKMKRKTGVTDAVERITSLKWSWTSSVD